MKKIILVLLVLFLFSCSLKQEPISLIRVEFDVMSNNIVLVPNYLKQTVDFELNFNNVLTVAEIGEENFNKFLDISSELLSLDEGDLGEGIVLHLKLDDGINKSVLVSEQKNYSLYNKIVSFYEEIVFLASVDLE